VIGMPDEKLDPRLAALLEEDPIAFFSALADLRKQGQDPVELGIVPGNPVTRKVKSADRWAAQQIKNAQDAADDWLDGVLNPSRNPIEAAIAAKDKWEDRLKQAIADKKFEKGLAKSSLSEIQEIAKKVGSGTYSTGVGARESKIKRVVGELQPLVQSVSDTIQAMGDKTDAEREKRLLSARKLMIEVGKKRRG